MDTAFVPMLPDEGFSERFSPEMRFPPRPWLRMDPGCVVSYCPIASAIGVRVLSEGGNAVDAAVATAIALSVTYPQAGNLAGGGFMLVHRDGEVFFLDYRERAPHAIDPAAFVEADGRLSKRAIVGGLSVAVPGTVAGLAAALERFGSWSWDRVVSLCIPLAEKGVWLTARQAACLEIYRDSLSMFESTRRKFFPGGQLPPAGAHFVQADLGWSLRELAENGPGAFYTGRISEKLLAEIQRHGGVLDREDLSGYLPIWRVPLRRKFAGREIFTSSLPSAGGLVLSSCLGLLEASKVDDLPRSSSERLDLLLRVFKVGFAYEHSTSGDPDYLDPRHAEQVFATAEAQMMAEDLARLEARLPATASLRGDPDKARQSNTTHFCVIDRNGMAVSNTYTLNTLFGSKLVVEGAGFLLNNSVDDFRISPNVPNWYDLLQGDRNQLRPGRRPVSSMTPTIVLSEGKVELVLGASGGPRIPTSLVQTIVGVLVDRISLGEAIRSPRVHHQLFPDEAAVEYGMSESVAYALGSRGHNVIRVNQLGICAAIRRNILDDSISAVLDPRFGEFW
jgi:gamma-glutamyltranspeptidase / glutathione hydrolase